jgi:hypothetical protein
VNALAPNTTPRYYTTLFSRWCVTGYERLRRPWSVSGATIGAFENVSTSAVAGDVALAVGEPEFELLFEIMSRESTAYPIKLRNQQLLLYTIGDFFKPHVDKPHTPTATDEEQCVRHLGTPTGSVLFFKNCSRHWQIAKVIFNNCPCSCFMIVLRSLPLTVRCCTYVACAYCTCM